MVGRLLALQLRFCDAYTYLFPGLGTILPSNGMTHSACIPLPVVAEPGTERERVSPHTAGTRSHGSPDKRPGCGGAGPATDQASSSAAARAVDAAVASAVQQAQAGAEGARAEASGSLAEHPAARTADETLSQVLSVEWVDAVVQEMMSARDLDDARQRAARFLQTFGSAVLEKASAAQVLCLPRPLPSHSPLLFLAVTRSSGFLFCSLEQEPTAVCV